jgi:hypothetical protein
VTPSIAAKAGSDEPTPTARYPTKLKPFWRELDATTYARVARPANRLWLSKLRLKDL